MKSYASKIVLAFFIAFGYFTNAQVATTYTFSQTNSVYTPLVGGTVLGTTANDDEAFLTNVIGSASNQTAPGFPIGFILNYNGSPVTQFGVSTNGFITVGNLPAYTMPINGCGCYGNPPSGTVNIANGIDLFANSNLISALNYDLQGQPGSTLKYQTIGSTPNQTLVVEWSGYSSYGLSGDNYNFQIQLVQTSNIILFVYGPFTHDGTIEDARVGLYGTSNADFYMRSDPGNWSTTIDYPSSSGSVLFTNTSLPPNGLTFVYTPPSSLPIELLSFSAEPQGQEVDLNWSTASESNNKYFTIEKSKDGIDFAPLKNIDSKAVHGSSLSQLQYSDVDAFPFEGISYYRLKQTDYDGTSKYSKTVDVDFNQASKVDISAYPNPNQGEFTLKFKGIKTNTKVQVEILDAVGKIVYDNSVLISEGANSMQIIPTEKIPAGFYFLSCEVNGITYTEKLSIN